MCQPSGREMVDLYVSAGRSGREMVDFYVSAGLLAPSGAFPDQTGVLRVETHLP